jgi:hypothetical protein
LIERNYLHDSNPVRLGGTGDHADFIHFWTQPTTTTAPTSNLVIRGNLMDQNNGAAIMGVYLDDNRNGIGFQEVTIEANVIITGNGQGIRLENAQGRVVDNVLLQKGDASSDPRNAPTAVLRDASVISFAGNRLADPNGLLAAAGEAVDNALIKGGVQPLEALDLARWGWARGLAPR